MPSAPKRVAALDAAAASGIVAAHECAGPEIGGLDDWRQLRAVNHGVQVTGYWGEAVTSPAQARALVGTPVQPGWPVTSSSTAPWAHAPPGCMSPMPMPRTGSGPATWIPRSSPRM